MKQVKWFWLALAVLYLSLAIASAWAAWAYNQRAQYAPPVWMDQHRTTHYGGRPEGDQVVMFEPWRELGNYLNWVTGITLVGFILAAAAAFREWLLR